MMGAAPLLFSVPRVLLAALLVVGLSAVAEAQTFPSLTNLSPSAVDGSVATPVSTTGPDTLAVDRVRTSRSYVVSDGVLNVAFCNGSSYALALTLDAVVTTPEALLTRIGLATTLTPTQSDDDRVVWEGLQGYSRVTAFARDEGWGGISATALADGCRPE